MTTRVPEQQHLDWIEQLQAFVRAPGQATAPPLDEQNCPIGRWIHGAGHLRHGTRPEFAAVDQTHVQIHRLAQRLAGRASGGDPVGLDALQGDLAACRDDFLDQLRALQRAVAGAVHAA